MLKNTNNFSFWEKETFLNNIDVVIIGSGIVGLSAALNLKKLNKKLRVVVLERGILPLGASSKNAGFACFGSCTELLDDLEKVKKEDEVFKLVEKRYKGLQKLRKNLGDKNIGYRNWGGMELFDNSKSFEECREKLSFLNKKIAPITGSKETYVIADKKIKKFGFQKIDHLIENKFEGQINTGKMIHTLASKVQGKGVSIINNLEVIKLNEDGNQIKIETKEGVTLTAKQVLIATNGFAKQLLPELDVHPARAQVLITSPIKNLKIKGTFHYNKGYYYFRNIGNRILFGGGRNLDFKKEETTEFGLTDKVQNRLEELLKTVILPHNEYQIEHRWSGIMGVGPEKKSIVKQISPKIFCAVRMGGMGIAIGSLIGEEAADILIESR